MLSFKLPHIKIVRKDEKQQHAETGVNMYPQVLQPILEYTNMNYIWFILCYIHLFLTRIDTDYLSYACNIMNL